MVDLDEAPPLETTSAPAEGCARVLRPRRRGGVSPRPRPRLVGQHLAASATAGSPSSSSRRAPRSRSCSSSSRRRRGRHSEGTLSYHTTGVFLLPAALLLAPPLAALVPVVQHLPEWLKKRQPWYVATFNIFNYTLTMLAALGRQPLVARAGRAHLGRATPACRRGLAACVAYVSRQSLCCSR